MSPFDSSPFDSDFEPQSFQLDRFGQPVCTPLRPHVYSTHSADWKFDPGKYDHMRAPEELAALERIRRRPIAGKDSRVLPD